MTLFPLASFDRIDNVVADNRLLEWGHYLGDCNRPFGRQSFALFVGGTIVSVAVSASTVSATCAGRPRETVLELARLCTEPNARWATRVCLRFWRELAPSHWRYWPVQALVSYQSAIRHTGDVYRFDGWTKVADTPGSSGGGTWASKKEREPKALWIYELRRAA